MCFRIHDRPLASTIQRAATVDSSPPARGADRHPVGIADLDVDHAGRPEQVDSGLVVPLAEVVLEPAAVELPARNRRVSRRPALDPLGDARVVAGREPEAQPALADLIALHVLHQAEHLAEVVAGDLLGRLPDLERGLRGAAGALLGDEDARVGTRLLELQAERQSGQSAPEDRDVVRLGGMLFVTQGASCRELPRFSQRQAVRQRRQVARSARILPARCPSLGVESAASSSSAAPAVSAPWACQSCPLLVRVRLAQSAKGDHFSWPCSAGATRGKQLRPERRS